MLRLAAPRRQLSVGGVRHSAQHVVMDGMEGGPAGLPGGLRCGAGVPLLSLSEGLACSQFMQQRLLLLAEAAKQFLQRAGLS